MLPGIWEGSQREHMGQYGVPFFFGNFKGFPAGPGGYLGMAEGLQLLEGLPSLGHTEEIMKQPRPAAAWRRIPASLP